MGEKYLPEGYCGISGAQQILKCSSKTIAELIDMGVIREYEFELQNGKTRILYAIDELESVPERDLLEARNATQKWGLRMNRAALDKYGASSEIMKKRRELKKLKEEKEKCWTKDEKNA